jgi:hypothetical protein
MASLGYGVRRKSAFAVVTSPLAANSYGSRDVFGKLLTPEKLPDDGGARQVMLAEFNNSPAHHVIVGLLVRHGWVTRTR